MSGDLGDLHLRSFFYPEDFFETENMSTISGIKPLAALTIDKIIRDDWRRWKRQWTNCCVIHSVT